MLLCWLRRILWAAVGLAWLPGAALAAPMTVISTPQESSGPFRYNVFHTAGLDGGAGGNLLGWFDLDTSFGAANFYDPVTGDAQIYFDIFATSALSTQIGDAFLSTTTASGAVLGDAVEQDLVVGTLSWTIDLSSSVGGTFYTFLTNNFGAEVDHIWNIDTDFADVFYVTSTGGRTANSWDGQNLTLWAAGGNSLAYSGSSLLGGSGGMGGFGNTADMGIDLVVTVPEPQTLTLVGMGLLGLWLAGRRRVRRT